MAEPAATASSQEFSAILTRYRSMRAASRELPPPTLAERRKQLKALRNLLASAKHEIAAAISRDFGYRAPRETLLSEILPALTTIHDALANTGRRLRSERRSVDLHFWPAENRLVWQPKGVVLIIAPWNYPLLLTIAPLVAALAAGNRVILKPSELTPTFSALLKRGLEGVLGADTVSVAIGGEDMAQALTALPFDHILFTGSARVGRLILQAAARTLTPVTLELGGKSPALVHESYDLGAAAARIARGKLMNAGQTCVAPDYVLAPAAKVDEFAHRYQKAAVRLYPSLLRNPDYSSIVSDRAFLRLQSVVGDARARGARVLVIDPADELIPGEIGDRATRKIAPTVLTGVSEQMVVMQEEIFGPLLPIVPYTSLNDAIGAINARPRPLALYYFDTDRARISMVMERTVSGGASINDTILHVAQEGLPFGGVGASGMGAYHGDEGFRTFSHARGVFLQSRLAQTSRLDPPYGPAFDRITGFLVRRFSGWRWR